MSKAIFILNGAAGVGKDTFADMLGELVPVMHYSSVTKVKRIAMLCGWDGVSKTEKDRKFLSDLKVLTSKYCDMSFRDIRNFVNAYGHPRDNCVLLIDIREPEDIERAVKEFGAKTILIRNPRVKQVTSNMADAGVFEYPYYHFTIDNDGTLDELRAKVEMFADMAGLIFNDDPFEDDLK